ncbi:hypothetical protein [Nocardia sp. NPDC050413]|uniref:tetratricopeptide repeat protein n=1 Tax=Nocardia sp. NPDC050413 TaxID=3155784 RepID=UPI0033D2B5EF
MRLFPDDASSWLLVAWLRAFGSPCDAGRARAALSEAIALSPEDVEVHRSAAAIYARLLDHDAARRHRAAGLEIDPTQPELLYLQARSEFTGLGGRTAAVATLRSLLAQTPTYDLARLMLAEICWRALMRLAAWVWVFAGCVAAMGIWGRPWLLRLLTVIFIAVLVRAWTGVFGALRDQLPPDYLRARTSRRPAVLLALVLAVAAGATVVVGAGAMWSADAAVVRFGCRLLVLGALGAALAHLLIFAAWFRRGQGDVPPEGGSGFAGRQLVVSTMVLVPVAVIVWFVRGWTRQPAVAGALSAVLGIALLTFLIEWIREFRPHGPVLRKPRVFVLVLVLVSVAAATTAAVWSGGREIDDGVLRSREVVRAPAPLPSTVPVTPTPTLVRLPTVAPVPAMRTPRVLPMPTLYVPSYFRLPDVGRAPIVTPDR